MHSPVTFVICLVLIVATKGHSITNINSRIVNGENAKIGEFPFQVSLQTNLGHFCGGSVLSRNYVLTAGHCVDDKQPESVTVIAGTINKNVPHSKHRAIFFKVHDDYFKKALINDIALIKIDPPFEFSSLIQSVHFPGVHEVIPTNTTAVVTGWGRLVSSTSNVPDILQKANIYVTDQEYCRKIMKEVRQVVLKTNICANDFTQRKGQCNGDSGGPLTIGNKLIGIVSHSYKDPDPICGSVKYPGIYTRVSEYIDWILENATV